ncbi:MAG: NADH-quinone oxidoreductase subunit J [Rhodospirillaceae bacterium]|jgi:NADH-quinone oxidoreductase subunit J|nr:NADH-quinone oxidoreductase subunit J [Rhodospirillaceae bacterium]MBT5239591.1 NADH-quinone oxidoreductase subunit J [Rhodospirillaceae bacterium]MBT5564129.1 NADH-quinone oxidoreductase subunit J [Rhodospirillaceae bacterium]MBT6089924.1 NADH-quinone oxidoreductase subunit J [Rhodospirillaceae bacterium]MBT6959665.1 NADH-quinone oxidoreductase subunit J [Rhodospirillaceae bacterium]
MIAATLAFYLFAALAIVGGLNVIFQRNPVHSVLWLIFTFFNAAGLFVLLGAEFVAMILVIVYVGAVAVLFLFVVMMLDINITMVREGFFKYMPIGLLVGGILLAELITVFAGWVMSDSAEAMRAAPAPDPSVISNTEALGLILYTDYVYLFQASGIILLVAMIGSIVLTHRTRTGVRKQVISEQNARRPEDTLEIVKVESGKGLQ